MNGQPIQRRRFLGESAAWGVLAALAAQRATSAFAAGTAADHAAGTAFGRRPFAGDLARGAAAADGRKLARHAFGHDDKLLPGLRDAESFMVPGVLAPLDLAALGQLLEPLKSAPPLDCEAGVVLHEASPRGLGVVAGMVSALPRPTSARPACATGSRRSTRTVPGSGCASPCRRPWASGRTRDTPTPATGRSQPIA